MFFVVVFVPVTHVPDLRAGVLLFFFLFFTPPPPHSYPAYSLYSESFGFHEQLRVQGKRSSAVLLSLVSRLPLSHMLRVYAVRIDP